MVLHEFEELKREHALIIERLIKEVPALEDWQETEIRKLIDDYERESQRFFERIEEVLEESKE